MIRAWFVLGLGKLLPFDLVNDHIDALFIGDGCGLFVGLVRAIV